MGWLDSVGGFFEGGGKDIVHAAGDGYKSFDFRATKPTSGAVPSPGARAPIDRRKFDPLVLSEIQTLVTPDTVPRAERSPAIIQMVAILRSAPPLSKFQRPGNPHHDTLKHYLYGYCGACNRSSRSIAIDDKSISKGIRPIRGRSVKSVRF